MSVSRRSFLELGALSATGLILSSPARPAVFPLSPNFDSDLNSGQATSGGRLEYNFDYDWQFFRPRASVQLAEPQFEIGKPVLFASDFQWEAATLPHSVRLEPRDVSGGQNYRGLCWYRKHFALAPDWKDRILYLNFQGAMQVADVWLNGKHLTTHYGGYIPFTLDFSSVALFDQPNELVVRLDNTDNPEVPPGKPQGDLDFLYFGGLYRSVRLQVLQKLHISDAILRDKPAGGGLFVTYPAVSAEEAVAQVKTEVQNESNAPRRCVVRQELVAPNGEVAANSDQTLTIAATSASTATQILKVLEPTLWHPEHPHLYTLRTTVLEDETVVDTLSTRIGIRSIRFEPERGLILNGKPFFSVGANRHQDHPYVGYALPPSAHRRDAIKLREAGFTSFRSHYPHDLSFMDACDELGILTIVSNPGWQFMGDDLFRKRVYQDAREVIRLERNRPSVIIWEAQLNETDNSTVAVELYRIVHEEYPGPEAYSAGDVVGKQVEGFHGWDVNYVSRGERDMSKPFWIREWGDQVDNWSDQQGRVRVARGWGEVPMQVQASSHLASLDKIHAMSPLPAGADLWAGIDSYRGYHHQPFLGAPLDVFRLPKFDYFMFQSQRPAEKTQLGIGSGPMVFIANYATFHSPSTVVVFSNCEQVRLYQNGKSVATQKPDTDFHVTHPPFSFKVGDFSETRSMLFASGVAPAGTEIGELRAEGLIGGKVVASHLIHSPGVPTSIELKLDSCGVDPVANGVDWVRVYAHICDARGTTHPYADDLVTFSVKGGGSILGDASIGANPVRAEAGIATALVRTTWIAGAIEVRASAPGLKDAVLQFDSKKSNAVLWPVARG